MWMRGGTSKGGYFLASDLPSDRAARDAFLLSVMGSPDPLQIDGMGGGDPLRSKVAVVAASARPGVDVDVDAVLAHLSTKVAKWWLPDRVIFVDALPHSATGKLKKAALREEYRGVLG